MWKYHQPVKLPPGQRNPEKRMNLDRRKLLTASASVAAGVFFGSKQAIATVEQLNQAIEAFTCLLYTSPSPRDKRQSRMPSSA